MNKQAEGPFPTLFTMTPAQIRAGVDALYPDLPRLIEAAVDELYFALAFGERFSANIGDEAQPVTGARRWLTTIIGDVAGDELADGRGRQWAMLQLKALLAYAITDAEYGRRIGRVIGADEEV